MNITSVMIQTIGGLAMFILGMQTMSNGLQQVAGARVKAFLQAVSANRFIGLVTGTGVTALIQSSSATTVMLIGFVNAGLMNLHQAVGVILGANIGTTVTAQLIAFKITDAALPAVALGVALRFIGKRRRTKQYGDVLLGFGLLFYGLMVMKSGLSPLKHDPAFVAFFTRFAADSMTGVLLCVLTGAVLTMVVQSSSATVGLTIALAAQGLIPLPGAIALVLGENIGTTITAQLATIGSGSTAHQTANAHTLFNVLGVAMMILVFPYFVQITTAVTAALGVGPAELTVGEDKPNMARYIANAHTLFNVVSALFFTVFLGALTRTAVWLTPQRETPDADLFRVPELDDRYLTTPSVALPQVKAEVIRMADAVEKAMHDVVDCLHHKDLKKLSQWRQREEAIDAFQREITSYLTRIYQGQVGADDAKEISSLLRMSNNLERIGDSVEKVARMIEDLIENDLAFTDEAVEHIEIISRRVIDFMRLVCDGTKGRVDNIMDLANRLEDEIDLMREEFRQGYIERLRSGVCMLDPSLIFIDMLTSFEKMGDYCFNIAQAIAGEK